MNTAHLFYPSADIDAACWDTGISFDPQLPLGAGAGTQLGEADTDPLPPAVRYGSGGRLNITFAAKNAAAVTCDIYGTSYPLTKGSDGIWAAEIDCGRVGFCPVTFYVDGCEVLNPLAPVGYGGSRPINFLDIPSPDGGFYALQDVPHGTVCQNYYYSGVTGTWRSCLVYLPACYSGQASRRFPVLYLQHGHGENEQCWVHQGRANFILDNLIAGNRMEPCIAVMNNGMVQAVEDGVRILRLESFEDMLINECIPFIDRTYRTKTDKWNRAMAGLSMGSLQTSIVTLKHPGVFGYAGVFSGFVSPLGGLWSDETYLSVLDDKTAFEQAYKLFFRACGDTDLVALPKFESDSRLFFDKGLSPAVSRTHIEKYYHGGHEWNVWRECLRDFAQLIFRPALEE